VKGYFKLGNIWFSAKSILVGQNKNFIEGKALLITGGLIILLRLKKL
jgi:hypothetical protein